MDWTKVTASYFSSAQLQICLFESIFARLRLSCDSPGWFNVMHVVAELMFSSKEQKNTALSLQHTTNGHFHVAALAKLTNASTPDNPSRDCGKTFSESKTASRTFFSVKLSEISPLLFQTLRVKLCWDLCPVATSFQLNMLLWALNGMESFREHIFNEKLIPVTIKNTLRA